MFRQPLETQRPAINKVKINPVHQLVALAGDDGVLECWDPRDRTRVSALSIADSLGIDQPRARASLEGSPATALRFGGDGLTMAVGTGAGVVLLYDLRRARPLLLKDHRYGLPIVDVKFHRAADKVGLICACVSERGSGGSA
jgi:ribosome biogenesis protein ENP2